MDGYIFVLYEKYFILCFCNFGILDLNLLVIIDEILNLILILIIFLDRECLIFYFFFKV